jgi:flavorubredoxin
MTTINEVAPDVFRINTYIPEIQLGFTQYLVKDDEPLLYHTGMRSLFPLVRDAVASLIDPATLRWVGFSHFEADECGSLNEWQEIAPQATAVCSFIGKVVSVDDFAPKNPAKAMDDGEILETGKHRFRFIQTPHVPHCWEAGLLFEETNRVLFCSDLMHQNGDVEPITSSDLVGRARQTFIDMQGGPLDGYFPYTVHTDGTLKKLAALKPQTLATMHGSVFSGDGERALLDYAEMVRETIGNR